MKNSRPGISEKAAKSNRWIHATIYIVIITISIGFGIFLGRIIDGPPDFGPMFHQGHSSYGLTM